MFLPLFVRWWKSEDDPETIDGMRKVLSPYGVEAIVPISFVTGKESLTYATLGNMRGAVKFSKMFPDARVAWSSCSYPFPGAEEVENAYRVKMLKNERPRMEPIIAGPMINSVDEAMKIKEKLAERGISPKCILLVTGELHSRSARYIWKKVFPGTRILVSCIPYTLEIQPDHPVKDQRVMWKWVLSNILRQAALRVLPLDMVRKIQHKAAH